MSSVCAAPRAHPRSRDRHHLWTNVARLARVVSYAVTFLYLDLSKTQPMRAVRDGILPVLVFAVAACGDDRHGDRDGGSRDGSPSSDAGSNSYEDASPLDCPADHAETLESQNDRVVDEAGDVEATGLSLGDGGEITICGQIDPSELTREIIDADVYSFEVESTLHVRLELEAEGGASLDGFEMSVFSPEGPTFLASGPYNGNHGVLTQRLTPGVYWVSVVARAPAPTDPVPYSLRIAAAEPPCPVVDGPATYEESGDGPDQRGNDTVAVLYNAPETPFSLTSDVEDLPEQTTLVLQSGDAVLIRGESGDVDSIDDYFDRDTYLIEAAPDVDEIAIRLSWDHEAGVDLDFYLFVAGALDTELSLGGASGSGASVDEVVTVAISPSSELWLWIGAFAAAELPASYEVSICASSFAGL